MKTSKIFSNIERIFLIIIPFSTLLKVFFHYKLDFWPLAYLREILLAALCLLALPYIKAWKNKTLFYLSCAFVIYSLATLAFNPEYGLSFQFLAMKNELYYYGLLVLALIIPYKLNIKPFLQSFGVMLWIGFLIYLIDPSLFVEFGFRDDYSTFYLNQAPAYCQRIEASPVCRFQGLLEGPNKIGVMILMYLFLAWKHYRKFTFNILLALVALFLSYSRSSFLGLILGFLAYISMRYGKSAWDLLKIHVKKLLATGLALLAGIAINLDAITKPASTLEHWEKWKEGWAVFLEAPWFGQGVGIAGPTSWSLAEPLIVESHFLAVLINTGILGFGLFIILYGYIVHKFYQQKQFEMAALWIAMLIPLNLLHSYESLAISSLLFWLTGRLLNNDSSE